MPDQQPSPWDRALERLSDREAAAVGLTAEEARDMVVLHGDARTPLDCARSALAGLLDAAEIEDASDSLQNQTVGWCKVVGVSLDAAPAVFALLTQHVALGMLLQQEIDRARSLERAEDVLRAAAVASERLAEGFLEGDDRA